MRIIKITTSFLLVNWKTRHLYQHNHFVLTIKNHFLDIKEVLKPFWGMSIFRYNNL